jgi:hypothetical protein
MMMPKKRESSGMVAGRQGIRLQFVWQADFMPQRAGDRHQSMTDRVRNDLAIIVHDRILVYPQE